MNSISEDKKNGEYIVFLGETTFPHGLAAIQRMTLMAKALLYDGYKVVVVCRKGGARGNDLKFDISGSFEDIDYVYTSGNIVRPDGFFKRNLLKVKGMIGEFKYLYRLKKGHTIRAAIISNHSAFHVLRYRIYSLIIGFPIILNFVELASSMKGRENILTKINDYIFDHYIVKIVDGALPISTKLMDYYKHNAPLKPGLKLPILCDFEKFDIPSSTLEANVFLYCGAASYLELIEFVIQSFDQLKNLERNIILELILGGSETEISRVRPIIEKAINKDNIRLVSNVDHKDIPQYYANASALLIPLRPTIQDEARFPHKIGEYLAAGRPMITTQFGEIKNYDFIDEKTALIADDYDVVSYSEKMKYILENPIKSKEIGTMGRQMGYDNFNFKNYGKIMRNYFSILKNQRR